MAVVVDVKSSYKGEQKVRNAIEEFFTDDAVVYNNREVNGREYDICLLVKDVCVFIVEVKGWLANKIKVHGVDEIEVEGYEEWQTSPKKQAKSYCIQYFSKIKKQFGSSPLVIDLVAYPFITKEEYYSSRLDIISEEQFTIFEDDLQDQNSLKRKFQAAFDAKKGIPHAELDTEFLSRIRRFEEPSFDDSSAEEFNQVYSELSIFPNIVDEERIKKIITAYFKGIKQILFVSQKSTFDAFLRELDSAYKKENIEPGDKIKVGYKKGVDFKRVNDLYRTFNFEIYLIEGLGAQCGENITIEEGKVSDNTGLLSWIANHSNFNFQQYCVEHASPEKNTLVEAGAGTGKTHSMVSRVAYLCNKRRNNISCIEDELAMVIEIFLQKLELHDDSERMMKYSNIALRILEAYAVELQRRKTGTLGATITKCYKQLANKKNLIQEIVMNPETLDMQYLDENGNEVSKESLSAGEKQLMIIAILWALALCSKKKLPVIIDTPLSRLDSQHRTSIISTYFPNASDQTIILSTDTEIDQNYYEMMKNSVGDEFTLVYSEETKSTSIKKGYFQEL